MAEDSVLLEIEGDGTARLTLNRPDKHNAFDAAMIARLDEIFTELAGRDDIRIVLLRGAGESFSAGADLEWMKKTAGYTLDENREDALKLAHMLHKLDALPQVTIAAVHGAAMGGGLGVAACCDIVVATSTALFALSEVRLGLIPATIAPYVLRAIGERQARYYFQSGKKFTGTRAYDIGLAHELVQDETEMEDMLAAMIDRLGQNGPEAMRAAKTLCFDFAGREVTMDVQEETAERIAAVRAGEEGREGVAAFLEKRDPEWKKP